VINFEEKPVENNRALTKKKKLPISWKRATTKPEQKHLWILQFIKEWKKIDHHWWESSCCFGKSNIFVSNTDIGKEVEVRVEDQDDRDEKTIEGG
jgi:hypothetical protein